VERTLFSGPGNATQPVTAEVMDPDIENLCALAPLHLCVEIGGYKGHRTALTGRRVLAIPY